MRKSDRDALDPDYQRIRKLAHGILIKNGALGVYPTPIESLIQAVKLEVVEHDDICESYLKRLGRQARKSLKKAVGKVMGVLDFLGKIIHIDKAVHSLRRPFLKLHELGHLSIPWQKDIYTGMEDCELSLHPDVSEKFEREANIFATEVLFQVDGFDAMAHDSGLSIWAPVNLSKKVGASVYASVRRYVSNNHRNCAVMVLEPTQLIEGDGFVAKTRRILTSDAFDISFGDFEWPDAITPESPFGRFIPLGNRRASTRDVVLLTNLQGDTQECLVESFKTKYHTFVLIIG